MTKALLAFPPGWTLTAGGPHAAIPMLKGFLSHHGIEARCIDLNWIAGAGLDAYPDLSELRASVVGGDLSRMNRPFFAVEDKLVAHARRFGGDWNLQAGFEYADTPQAGAKTAYAALARPTPYEHSFQIFLEQLAAFQPDLVGFSIAASQQIVPALQLCARIRASGYDGFIVLGGNTVSRLAAELPSAELFALVDGLVTFQGELSLLRLCQVLKQRGSLEQVPSLIWWDGATRRNEAKETLNPNEARSPDFDDLAIGEYAGENYLTLVGARGCYYGRCSFCAIPYGWGPRGFAGARDASLVFDDMVQLAERHGILRFKFTDEAVSPHFMKALATLIRKHAAPFQWEGYTRLETAWNDDAFVRMVSGAGGFRKGYFGLELVSSSGRDALNKNDRPDPARLLELCASHDVKAHLFCMFGYPGTGEGEAMETIDFVLRNEALIDTADVFAWTLAKHTTVPEVKAVLDPSEEWKLEFEHTPIESGVLSSQNVRALADKCEDMLWTAAPRLLHPTYRMVSPWLTDTEKEVTVQRAAACEPIAAVERVV